MFAPFRSWQIADGAILNAHLSQEVDDRFTNLTNLINNLDATYSTDQERIDAIASLLAQLNTLGTENTTLEDAITGLASTLKTSMGTKPDGTYNTATGANYISSATSVHGATVLLDSSLKTVADAVAALSNSVQSNILGKDLHFEQATLVDWNLRRFSVANNITAVAYVAVNGGVLSPSDVSPNGGTDFDLPNLPEGASTAPVWLAYF